jgi:hypothetical protein
MQRRTLTFGGGGGGPFNGGHPGSLGLRGGSLLDAIIINGQKYGGDGGSATNIETLSPGEYWNSIYVRSGSLIDHLKLTSSGGRTVERGGDGGGEATYSNLRIISISGRCGSLVDSLSFDVVDGYVASTQVASNVEVIMGVETGGQTIKRFHNESTRTAQSYQKVSQHMMEWDVNASASGEYFAKFSASTSLKTSDSSTQTIANEASRQVDAGESWDQTIAADQAAFLVGCVNLMQDSSGNPWMVPVSAADWILLPSSRYRELAGKYDITGGAATQAGLHYEVVHGFRQLKA